MFQKILDELQKLEQTLVLYWHLKALRRLYYHFRKSTTSTAQEEDYNLGNLFDFMSFKWKKTPRLDPSAPLEEDDLEQRLEKN